MGQIEKTSIIQGGNMTLFQEFSKPTIQICPVADRRLYECTTMNQFGAQNDSKCCPFKKKEKQNFENLHFATAGESFSPSEKLSKGNNVYNLRIRAQQLTCACTMHY